MRHPRAMCRALFLLAGVAALQGCAPSADEIQAAFDAHVEGANACATDGECAIASAGCPLGCWVVVRAERVADVERRAAELIADYERGGTRCEYDCVAPGTPVCVAGRCASVP